MVTRALVFTDVVDSTRIAERLGEAGAAQAWIEHDRRARDLLAQHRGREVGRTDGLFALFEGAADAAGYVLAYHDALRDLPLKARVGLHVGPVSLRDNPAEDVARGAVPLEVDGIATAIAARVMALAGPEQTLVSRAAVDALAEAPPAGSELESHGYFRLKGIEAPLEIFELGRPGRAAFVPPADAEKAYRVVRAGDLWLPVREVRHNLPAERDRFVGRRAELRGLAARLDAGARLVTLCGTGGTGKTRLALHYGWTWLGDWPGGVYFADLSEARTLDGVFFAVASALEIPLRGDDPAVQIGHAIAGRGHCLVILDNFEQIVDLAREARGRWLDSAAGARFLVTSRERLHLGGEEVYPIEPLPVEVDAVELFETRARAQRPDFAVGANNRAAVAEVVRLLDGLPLAIELAAARIGILSPAQLVDRLRDRFAVLAGARGASARQATLRRAIDWSWELLAPWEQAAFAQCSIFDGGFTLDAAEAVLDLSPWAQAAPVIDVVQALSDKSLLRTWVPAGQRRHDIDEPFFGMYVSLREYAAEKLAAAGADSVQAAEQRHGRWFARFGTEEAIAELYRTGGVRRCHLLALELDNLLAACRRAIEADDSATATAAYRAAWEALRMQGPVATAASVGERLLALRDFEGSQRPVALVAVAGALRRVGRPDEARARLGEALALAREARAPGLESRARVEFAHLCREQSEAAAALGHYEAALVLAGAAGDRRAEADAHTGLGQLHRVQGRAGEAEEHLACALAIARAEGDRQNEAIVLGNLGLLYAETGSADEALEHLAAALAASQEVGDIAGQGAVHANLAMLLTEQGRSEEAREHNEKALAIHREVGNRRLEAIALGNLGSIDMGQGRRAQAQGRFEHALAIAREIGSRGHAAFLLAMLGNVKHERGRLDEARADYEAAVSLALEIGELRAAGIALERLGRLHVDRGEFDLARTCLERALARAREAGYPRLEGAVLCSMGALLAREGCAKDALESLRAGETLLRGVHDREELAKLLCLRGSVEAAAGERESARAALAEAEAIAQVSASGPESELCRGIENLRAALA